MKRQFEQLGEETKQLEEEYNQLVMEHTAKKAKLLDGIKQRQEKKSEWKAKIEELKKVTRDDDIV